MDIYAVTKPSKPLSSTLRVISLYNGNPPAKFNCSRSLPGMLSPMYHDLVCGNSVLSESSVIFSRHSFSASCVASQ